MSVAALRQELYTLIAATEDEQLLSASKQLLTQGVSGDSQIPLGYNTEGQPITVSAFLKRYKETEARMDSGQYFSQAEIEAQAKNW